VKHVIFTEEAERELAEASEWFDEHTGIGSSGFVALIREVVEAISETPFAAPPWSYAPEFRAWTLRRIPYRVIYEVQDQVVRIVAIAHTSRDPEHWLDRLR
jgi:toxin ParE1/3/4